MKEMSSCCKTPAMGAVLERPRFYPRQLVTPEILTLGHDYLRHKQRLHNRLLHGWGVVCGLMVCPAPAGDKASYEPWKVVVKPGYAFGPHGDGILVDCDSVVDLRTPAGKADAGCGEPAADPWCARGGHPGRHLCGTGRRNVAARGNQRRQLLHVSRRLGRGAPAA